MRFVLRSKSDNGTRLLGAVESALPAHPGAEGELDVYVSDQAELETVPEKLAAVEKLGARWPDLIDVEAPSSPGA